MNLILEVLKSWTSDFLLRGYSCFTHITDLHKGYFTLTFATCKVRYNVFLQLKTPKEATYVKSKIEAYRMYEMGISAAKYYRDFEFTSRWSWNLSESMWDDLRIFQAFKIHYLCAFFKYF